MADKATTEEAAQQAKARFMLDTMSSIPSSSWDLPRIRSKFALPCELLVRQIAKVHLSQGAR